jgi:hypothetical protein
VKKDLLKGGQTMSNENNWLTGEEKKVIEKLKLEVVNAHSLAHVRFYKREIEQIVKHAKRRKEVLQSISHYSG